MRRGSGISPGHQNFGAFMDAPQSREIPAKKLSEKLLRQRSVLDRVGWSRGTLYNRINAGEFPRQIRTGPRTVGWLESDVDSYIAACASARAGKRQ
jgi:prophage regulatory protein